MDSNKIISVLLDLSLTDPKSIEEVSGDEEAFLCFLCKVKITEKKYVTTVSGSSPYHTLTNPFGFSYNIMTVSYCEMVKESSKPVTEHSWFPGYAWSVLTCLGCAEHLGWRFMSVGDSQPGSFYGLIRDKLILSV